MIRQGLEFLTAARPLVRHPHRYAIAQRVISELRFRLRNRIPVDYFARLFPEVKPGAPLPAGDITHPFELPYAERFIAASLVSGIQPRTVFEFGTFTGTTTRLLADAAPGARVHTIDLAEGEIAVWEDWIGDVVGLAFRGRPEYADRIVQHRCDSRTFDYTELLGRCGLVFVDASHEYADVLHDSRRALALVAPNGVVLWDDYQTGCDGVVRALNELHAEGIPLARVAHTRLVVHRPGGFPVALPAAHPQPWSDAPDHGRPDRIAAPGPNVP